MKNARLFETLKSRLSDFRAPLKLSLPGSRLEWQKGCFKTRLLNTVFILECLLSIQNSAEAVNVKANEDNRKRWSLMTAGKHPQSVLERTENNSFRRNSYFKINKLHKQFLLCFSHWLLTLISLPAPLILHEHHLFLQSDRFDSSIFPPEAPTIWNSCSLPLHLIHLSSLCKSQLKTFIFPLAPIPFSLALFSSMKQSCTWLRTRLVCKILQTLSSP